MTVRRDAVTELVSRYVGEGRRFSTREFPLVAVDPESGWAPSKSLIAKIINGEGYKISPQLVGALAAGLGLSREVVAAAAHLQVIGYEESELESGSPARILRTLGEEPGAAERDIAARWEVEESPTTDK